jgi:hypothetical protein
MQQQAPARPFPQILRLPVVLLACIGAHWAFLPAVAAPDPAKVPEKIDLNDFPGEIIAKVVVPIPAEIFAVLNKLDEPDWNQAIALPEETTMGRERVVLALIFGSLVGEGFIAVQANNSEEIQQIGRRVLTVSEALSLAGAVRPHSLSIVEAADQRDWTRVRDELDRTQQTVRETMEKLRDEELSNLVSLGGWLRGTHVVAEIISESYSEDKAEILNQPGLIAHFRAFLETIEGPAKTAPTIRAISSGLARLEAIIEEPGIPTEEAVIELREISRGMLDSYYFVTPAAPAAATPAN